MFAALAGITRAAAARAPLRRAPAVARRVLALAAAALALVACANAWGEEKLSVWWAKGYYKAEDDAIAAIVRSFERKTGTTVELTQHPLPEMIGKTVAALDGSNPPDVAFAEVFDFQLTSKWAHDGKLEDLSDLVLPVKQRFASDALEATYLFDHTRNRHAYYAFPVKQQTLHVSYWADMLEDAGFGEADLPTGWKAFWSFWCDKVQPAYRNRTGKEAYALGVPMGVDASDSYWSFLTFMDAYGVKLLDDNGRLRLDDPKVKQGIVAALNDFTMPYRKGCTPPSAIEWTDADNNKWFGERKVMLTYNPGIAIPLKWRDDLDAANVSGEERIEAKRNYEQRVRTAQFPLRPDGTPLRYRSAVKAGVVFAAARNKRAARAFVRFLLQEENLTPYVEAGGGRWFPVTRAAQQRPFWSADPHRAQVRKAFASGTVKFEFTRNYRFTVLDNENVWARAVYRVAKEDVPADKAADELIAEIRAAAAVPLSRAAH